MIEVKEILWGVFCLSIIIGTCSSFFFPASSSSLPDIVPDSDLERANSLNSMVRSGGTIIGKALAGFLFALYGAPLLFIANGISYILSGLSESFMTIPPIQKTEAGKGFVSDLIDGGKYIWEHRAIRNIIIIAALQNFAFVIGEVLFLPYFREQVWLGPEKFGIFEAVSAFGAMTAMALLSVYTIPERFRRKLFTFSFIMQCSIMALVPLFSNFSLMLVLIFLSLFLNAMVNIMTNSVLQRSTPAGMRGKVFGFVGVLLTLFIPIGLSFGGILGGMFPIKSVITISLLIGSLLGFALIPGRAMKEIFAMSNDKS